MIPAWVLVSLRSAFFASAFWRPSWFGVALVTWILLSLLPWIWRCGSTSSSVEPSHRVSRECEPEFSNSPKQACCVGKGHQRQHQCMWQMIPAPEILEERGMDGSVFISGRIVGSRSWFLVNHRRDIFFKLFIFRSHQDTFSCTDVDSRWANHWKLFAICFSLVAGQIMVLVDTWVFRLMLFFSVCFCWRCDASFSQF